MNNQKKLLKKIREKKAKIAVIGLGYVGLPLAIMFAKSGFSVKGYIKTKKKIESLNNGISNVGFDKELRKVIRTRRFSVGNITEKTLKVNDIFIICVPTPIDKNRKPDLSSLKSVAKKLSQFKLDGKLLINESTVAPYTTRKILGSLGENYFLVCSPERIDPGSSKTVDSIPKIVGGINEESLIIGTALYTHVLKNKLVLVNSMEIAEMSKMLENTYRAVNIGLINEFAKLADSINIDILDVIHAAKSKWSFQAHYPGIGVGGHCIPVDPHYLLHLAKNKKMDMKIVQNSLINNEGMPEYIAQKISKNYKKGMRVLIYGLTYKKNVADLRESPVLVLCKLLMKRKIDFYIYDPLLDKNQISDLGLSVGKLETADILVVGTDHKELTRDYSSIVGNNTIVVDGRNFFLNKVGKKVLGVGRLLD